MGWWKLKRKNWQLSRERDSLRTENRRLHDLLTKIDKDREDVLFLIKQGQKGYLEDKVAEAKGRWVNCRYDTPDLTERMQNFINYHKVHWKRHFLKRADEEIERHNKADRMKLKKYLARINALEANEKAMISGFQADVEARDAKILELEALVESLSFKHELIEAIHTRYGDA